MKNVESTGCIISSVKNVFKVIKYQNQMDNAQLLQGKMLNLSKRKDEEMISDIINLNLKKLMGAFLNSNGY